MLLGALGARARPMTVTNATTVIFAPHADDETFGCGGLIARKVAAGATVRIVFLTDGGWNRDHCPKLRAEFVATRQGEALAAAQCLGVPPSNVDFLSFRDNWLERLPAQDRARAVERIAEILKEAAPDEVFVTHRADRNPDHEAAYRLVLDGLAAARACVRLFEYPIWAGWRAGLHLAEDAGRCRALRLGDARAAKRAAMAQYGSQDEFLSHEFVRSFDRDIELFFEQVIHHQAITPDAPLSSRIAQRASA